MLANQSGSEAGSSTVVAVVDGSGPGRWDGATGRGMQEANEVFLVRLVVCAGGRMECFVGWWKDSLIGEWDAPKTSCGVSGSVDDDVVVVVNFDIMSGETGFVAVITEGSDG